MVIAINCAHCGKEGCSPSEFDSGKEYWFAFPQIHITRYKKCCEACNHREQEELSYHFCSLNCLREWLNKNKDGLPCQYCEGTGDTNERFRVHGLEPTNPEKQKCEYCDNGLIKKVG